MKHQGTNYETIALLFKVNLSEQLVGAPKGEGGNVLSQNLSANF